MYSKLVSYVSTLYWNVQNIINDYPTLVLDHNKKILTKGNENYDSLQHTKHKKYKSTANLGDKKPWNKLCLDLIETLKKRKEIQT